MCNLNLSGFADRKQPPWAASTVARERFDDRMAGAFTCPTSGRSFLLNVFADTRRKTPGGPGNYREPRSRTRVGLNGNRTIERDDVELDHGVSAHRTP